MLVVLPTYIVKLILLYSVIASPNIDVLQIYISLGFFFLLIAASIVLVFVCNSCLVITFHLRVFKLVLWVLYFDIWSHSFVRWFLCVWFILISSTNMYICFCRYQLMITNINRSAMTKWALTRQYVFRRWFF